MKTKNWKETLQRAGRTFVQTAIAYMGVNLVSITAGTGNLDALSTALVGLLISAIAAGLAAVMNLPTQQGAINA